MSHGSPEDVLIVLEGVHQEIPDTPPANQQVYLAPPPPPMAAPAGTTTDSEGAPADGSAVKPPTHAAPGTEADKARALYQKTADSEDIVLGGGATGQNIKRPPDFSKLPVDPRTAAQGRGAPVPAGAPLEKKGTGQPVPAKGTAPATPDAIRHANQAAGGSGGKLQP
jgi:hypothetical protein